MTKVFIHDLFSRTAESFPGEIAVEHPDFCWTYRDLERRSNRLANAILDAGTAKGALIAIFSEDAAAHIVAVIAVLKAGCVFVPWDPAAPDRRLRQLAELAEPERFLTDTGLVPRLGKILGNGFTESACIGLERMSGSNADRPGVSREPDDLCYIYFTSGSSGTPKPVAGRLKSIAHFIEWEIETLGLGLGARVSQLIMPSFDAYLRDIFVPLCCGGTVCLPGDRDLVLDPRGLAGWVHERDIRLVHCVPSVFRSILNVKPGPDRFPNLKNILLSGEPLMPGDIGRWMDTFGDRVQLVNLYGPTETTMTKLFHMVTAADRVKRSVPIGKPMKGARALVMDDRLRPCTPGSAGQIYIRTPYRTLGYYRQPEQTAEVFIQNPFSENRNDLIYRTGDYGRMLENGSFEFLGRMDNQIKFHGVRIELGEIETCLSRHPDVAETVVVARRDPPEDPDAEQRMVAYISLTGEDGPDRARPDTRVFQDFLLETLPRAMVPSIFVVVDAFPRTMTGKVDRKALPSPLTHQLTNAYAAPRNPMEALLADIWSEILKRDRIGIHDNFFAMGGHSLLVTQTVSRIREVFRIEVPLRGMFGAPTIAELAEYLQSLQGREPAPPIEPAPEDAEVPLSFAQERLWFLHQWEEIGATYNMPFGLRFKGVLNVTALLRGLDEIARRHEALGVTFPNIDGRPALVFNEPRVRVGIVDGLGLSSDSLDVRQLAGREFAEPFNLADGPLFRIVLVRLGRLEHVLLATMHHMISDGWSIGVMVQELSVFYTIFADPDPGNVPTPPDLPIQYRDFAYWQRQWLSGAELERQETYWREKLTGAPSLMRLPTDRPRPAIQTYRGALHPIHIEPALTEKVGKLGKRLGITPFMFLQSALLTLLSRYSGQDDIVLGTPIANRDRKEIEPLIGFFVNTLALRNDLSGDPSFETLLQRARQTALDAYDHQHLPFERVVEAVKPERNLSHSPLFQVMFILQNAPVGKFDLPDLEIRQIPGEDKTAKFDLTVSLTENEDHFQGVFQYNTDLFEASTIRRMADHYLRLIGSAAADSGLRLSRFSFLSETERDTLLTVWNRDRDYPQTSSLADRFSDRVQQHPDRTVLSLSGRHLTFTGLDRRADGLARKLRAIGTGPETRVGLSAEPSFEMIVGILGIVKSGAAYVPLNPSYPVERLGWILEDAGISVWVGQEKFLDPLTEELAVEIPAVRLEEQVDSSGNVKTNHLSLSPDHLAYIIYTSGSTGRPKGVPVTHGNAGWLFDSARDHFDQRDDDAWALFHAFAFDVSVWEIWAPLVHGQKLVPVPIEVKRSPSEFIDLIQKERISVLCQTPSAFMPLMRESLDRNRDLTGVLRHVIFAGEALQVGSLSPWFDRFRVSGPRLINMYGITETTVYTTFHEIGADEIRNTIGKPMDGSAIHILDQHGSLNPVGVPGELHIGGQGLARGYLNRPDLTAERFVPDPHADRPGRRLYRSGDLARHFNDGLIDYLGRLDHQVKIRGFRIEPDEIASVLLTHPRVVEAVVVPRKTGTNNGETDHRLIAYARTDREASGDVPDAAGIRAFLRNRLPEHMMPAAYVFLDVFPLTPNGKLDIRALPAPDVDGYGSSTPMVPARNALEFRLTRIWEEVLDVRPIGVRNDFFELGGHSILAIRLMARIRQELGKELPLTALFQGRTIEHLSALVSGSTENAAWESLVPIKAEGSRPPLFMVHPVDGTVICYEQLGRFMDPAQPMYALQSRGFSGDGEVLTRVEDMAAHYIETVQSVQPHGPYHLAGWSFGGHVAYETARQLQSHGEEVALVAIVDTASPIFIQNHEPAKDRDLAVIINEQILGAVVGGLSISPEELIGLGEDALIDRICRELGDYLPPETGKIQVRQRLRIHKANVEALWRYRPEPFDGRLILLKSRDEVRNEYGDPTMGWAELAGGGVDLQEITGPHNSIIKEPHVAVLAQRLTECLTEEREPTPSTAVC